MQRGPVNTTHSLDTNDSRDADSAAPSLLALIDAADGDMGATLLRLAHQAAAQHRFAAATQHQTAGQVMLDRRGGGQ